MNAHTMNLTRDGLISALAPRPAPSFLIDVLRIKRARGDIDCDAFKSVADTFAYKLNATIAGATRSMEAQIKARDAGKMKWVGEREQEMRRAFVADCRAALSKAEPNP